MAFNRYGVWAIYRFEMARFKRTIVQSLITPVVTTSLYFVVFGGAIGSRMREVDGINYGAFIVPGLIMLSLFTNSISNAGFGIYMPKFTGTVYELLSAPISFLEMVLGYVGAAATKSLTIGVIILGTASLFVPLEIRHPIWMVAFLLMTGGLQPVRLHAGALGQGVRATAANPHAGDYPADVSRWRILLDRHAGADLAGHRDVESNCLRDRRLSLEFF